MYLLDDLQRKHRIKKLLRWAMQSEFYSQKYSGYEEALQKGELQRLPYTTKEEIDFDKLATVDKERFVMVGRSSGTVDKPTFLFFTPEDMKNTIEVWTVRCWQFVGLTNKDVFLNLTRYDNLHISGYITQAGSIKLGMTVIPYGAGGDPDQILSLIKRFGVTSFVFRPSHVMRLGMFYRSQGVEPSELGIQKIIVTGEWMSKEFRRMLEELWGADVYVLYTMTEAMGDVGSECKEKDGTHIFDDYFLIELRELSLPEKSVTHTLKNAGEIILTTMRENMPFIRYRTGDLGMEISKKCGCGSKHRRIHLLGRVNEVLRVGSLAVTPLDIQTLLLRIPGMSGLYTLTVDGKEASKLHLEIETLEAEHTEHKKQEIRDLLLENLEVESSLVSDIDIKLVPLSFSLNYNKQKYFAI